MTRSRLVWVLAVGVGLAGVAGPSVSRAQSVSAPPLSIPELTARSELVVLGEVVSVQSEWNAAKTAIITTVEVRGDMWLKGLAPGGVVSVSQIGGQAGDVASAVGGAPAFAVGERVLIFLSRRREGTLGVTGLFQGKFSVERDPSSGREIAVRRVPGQARALDEVPLERTLELIRRALGGIE